MRKRKAPSATEIEQLERWLARELVPVEADPAFVQRVYRRLAIEDPRPVQVEWYPPDWRQYIWISLAVLAGPLAMLAVWLIVWFYRRRRWAPSTD
ncbi:MAG: hypothetical protein GXO36_04115 [Chloroflexi bacterium]|nr:hypothetical protein [Chloroflexota bacterium]